MFSKLDFRPSPPLDGAAAAARRTFQSQPSSPATRTNIHGLETIQTWNFMFGIRFIFRILGQLWRPYACPLFIELDFRPSHPLL